MSQAAPLALGASSARRGLAWRQFTDIAFQVMALVVLLSGYVSLLMLYRLFKADER